MQDGLQIFPLTRVLAVKELQQPHHKGLVYVLLGRLCLCVIGDHVSQQEFIHYLQQAGHNVDCHCSVRQPKGGLSRFLPINTTRSLKSRQALPSAFIPASLYMYLISQCCCLRLYLAHRGDKAGHLHAKQGLRLQISAIQGGVIGRTSLTQCMLWLGPAPADGAIRAPWQAPPHLDPDCPHRGPSQLGGL